jgi:hypothetical protein
MTQPMAAPGNLLRALCGLIALWVACRGRRGVLLLRPQAGLGLRSVPVYNGGERKRLRFLFVRFLFVGDHVDGKSDNDAEGAIGKRRTRLRFPRVVWRSARRCDACRFRRRGLCVSDRCGSGAHWYSDIGEWPHFCGSVGVFYTSPVPGALSLRVQSLSARMITTVRNGTSRIHRALTLTTRNRMLSRSEPLPFSTACTTTRLL